MIQERENHVRFPTTTGVREWVDDTSQEEDPGMLLNVKAREDPSGSCSQVSASMRLAGIYRRLENRAKGSANKIRCTKLQKPSANMQTTTSLIGHIVQFQDTERHQNRVKITVAK